MGKNHNLRRLTFFPRDGKLWRIDWFGAVEYPNRADCYRHPSIEVAFSQVVPSEDEKGFIRKHRSAKSQKSVWAPVGWLAELKVGDIWRDGHRVKVDRAERLEFSDLRISSKTTAVVKAGISLETGDFLLPLRAHPWHLNHTQSHCLMVNLPGERRLVIPCVELIRFYFGTSSSLLGRLFLPGLERKSMARGATLNPVTRMLKLDLQPTMSGYAAADIGRILCSHKAFNAAAAIGISLLKGSTRQKPAYPATFFPFSGSTDLTVIGEWLPHGEQPARTFLVHSIQSCTHPFPFNGLRYKLDRAVRARHILHGQRRIPKSQSALTHSQVGAQLIEFVNSDPSSRFAIGSWLASHEVKFLDLINKPVFREVTDRDLRRPDNRHTSRASNADAVAVGPATGTGRNVRPIDADVIAPTLDTENAPEFLREYLRNLAAIPGIDLAVISDSHQDGWTIPVNALQDDTREVDKRLLIKDKGVTRIRRACVLSVATAQRPLGKMVLIEGPSTFGHYLSGTPDTNDELAYCLEYSALQLLTGAQRLMQDVVLELKAIANT